MTVTLQLVIVASSNCPEWEIPTPESVADTLKNLLNGEQHDVKTAPQYWFAQDVKVIKDK